MVERSIDLDRPTAEVWALLATADGWCEWMVDSAAIEVASGAVGSVVDDEVHRRVCIRHVDEGQGLTFAWWEHDDPASASEVTITLHELGDGGSRVHVIERAVLGAAVRTAQPSVWEVRACLLAMALHSPARV